MTTFYAGPGMYHEFRDVTMDAAGNLFVTGDLEHMFYRIDWITHIVSYPELWPDYNVPYGIFYGPALRNNSIWLAVIDRVYKIGIMFFSRFKYTF